MDACLKGKAVLLANLASPSHERAEPSNESGNSASHLSAGRLLQRQGELRCTTIEAAATHHSGFLDPANGLNTSARAQESPCEGDRPSEPYRN